MTDKRYVERFIECVIKMHDKGLNNKQILSVMGCEEINDMLTDDENFYSFSVNGIWINEEE